MKILRIQPKNYISERFVVDYYDYTKKEAIKMYREKFPQFTMKEIIIN